MKTADPWTLLRAGQIEEGLRPLQKAHARQPSPSHIMELGVAYLWAKRYDAAWEHFNTTNETFPGHTSDFYGMAGVAKWCLGEYDAAIANWQVGLDAKFSDTAGLGVKLPLLLFFAAGIKPSLYPQNSAETLLLAKSADERSEEWPGPVACWLVGRMAEGEFEKLWKGFDDVDTRDRVWLAEFYAAVKRYQSEDASRFKECMRSLSDTSSADWSNETFFLARMWSEEYFLARYEAVNIRTGR